MDSMGIYNSGNLGDSIQTINSIKEFLKQHINIDDFFVFCDSYDTHTEYAVLPSFYLYYYKGTVVFLNLEDYIAHKDKIISTNIIIRLSKQEVFESHIDRSVIKGCNILYQENDQNMEFIKNYGI